MGASDVRALILSYLYVFLVIGLAEGVRRWRKLSPEFLRKTIHIGIGLWSIGTVLLFQNRFVAIIPPLSFVVLNYLSYRFQIVKSMDDPKARSLGTVYFPLAFALAILLLWDHKTLVVASLMPLTWGDAMAALLGRQFSQYRYTVLGSQRSLEGSISMFLFSFAGVGLSLWGMPAALGEAALAGWAILGISALVAALAAIVEALTPWDLDNLTVPAICILALWLLAG